jgi:glycosyltransferase involved in cell wall biosynthesis
MTVYILQKRITEYRVGVFEVLAREIPDLVVLTEQAPVAEVEFEWRLLEQKRKFCLPLYSMPKIRKGDVIISGLNLRSFKSVTLFVSEIKRFVIWGHGIGSSRVAVLGMIPRILAARFSAASIFYTNEGMQRFTGFVETRKLFVATNTISLPKYEKPDVRELDTFLYFGDLRAEKRVDLLIDAFSLFCVDFPDVRLVIVGNGLDEGRLIEKAVSKECSERISFFPRTGSPDQLKEYLDRAIATVSPGHVGLSVVQSFWAGVPIITSRLGHHAPEFAYCVHGFNSLLFDGSVSGLERSMREIYKKDFRDALGENARDYFLRNLTMNSIIDGFRGAIRIASLR